MAHLGTECIGYMGVGAPVTHNVSGHRALKNISGTTLQPTLDNINKFTSLTNKMTKVGNHKPSNFVQNEPEHLWPLLIWIKYNK